MLKCSIYKQNGKKRVNVNVDQMQALAIIDNAGKKTDAGANAKNLLIKVCVIKDLFGIQVIMNVNAINHVMQVNIQTMKTVSAGKKQLINQLENVLKILMK